MVRVHTALNHTEIWLHVICRNPPWVYVTRKSPVSSLVVHTLKSMWIRESKRLCGNLYNQELWLALVESNFLVFMISLESEYYCWNGLLLLKLDCWSNLWKNKIKWLASGHTARGCPEQVSETGLLTCSLSYRVYEAILKNSPVVGMVFRAPVVPSCNRHVGSSHPLKPLSWLPLSFILFCMFV